jgi:hypothetical protein
MAGHYSSIYSPAEFSWRHPYFQHPMKFIKIKFLALAALFVIGPLSAQADNEKLPLKPGGAVRFAAAPPGINREAVRRLKTRPTLTTNQLAGSPRLSISTSPDKALPPHKARGGSEKKAATNPQQSQLNTSNALQVAAFTPLCPTLDINLLYTLSAAQAGDVACYHFAIAQRAKTTVILTGQNANTNFALSLLKDDGLNNLSMVGSSDNAGNADEAVLALTEPGNYYWYMEANAADGSAFNFGAAVTTQIDAYELNDAVSLSTVLPDAFNVLTANSDSTDDYDYYQFVAARGQDVRVRLDGVTVSTSGKWIVELLNGGIWQTLSNESNIDIGGFPPMQALNIRVRPNPSAIWDINSQYKLVFGSKPVFSSYNVSGESNIVRIPNSANTPYYMTTQAYQQLSWSVTMNDSKGAPLPGIESDLYLDKQMAALSAFVIYPLTTNSGGSASTLINLGSCSGDSVTEFGDYANGYYNTWRTWYNFGGWYIRFPDATDLGVGGTNFPTVTFGQICKQDLIHSVRS